MARKKKHEEHVNHERWLVSYADFITLLFATFTALFAISNQNMEKFKKLAASIKEAFNGTPAAAAIIEMPGASAQGGSDHNAALVINIQPAVATPSGDSDAEGAGENAGPKGKDEGKDTPKEVFEGTTNLKSTKPGKDAPEKTEGTTAAAGNGASAAGGTAAGAKAGGEGTGTAPTPEAAATEATPTPTPSATPTEAGGEKSPGTPDGGSDPVLAQEIKDLIDNAGLKGKVDVRQEQRGMVISLGEAAFFSAGSVDVHPESSHQLDKIANVLRGKNLEIRVEGHTDNTPVRSGRFKSNLELSTMRAARIVEFMINDYKFSPDRLSSAGYGEFRPVAENASDEGRAKNRRVDIVILNRRAAMSEPHAEVATTPENTPAAGEAAAPSVPEAHSSALPTH